VCRNFMRIKKTKFWRYERKSSFLTSRRDIPCWGGRMSSSGGNKAESSEVCRFESNVVIELSISSAPRVSCFLEISIFFAKKIFDT
jgi:hypothetical protein